ncbi:mycofactocin biosynthesis chaperone MftB [Williamsia serinedens]|uniref:Mycofactocin binding protein MftB n=1 Tax=Williamsia serinedens TaxID=391736 RepID=A0ABT1H2H3_9NOCA|nr:mycofactocin biosynthesis chaperone MftB [Williamsia serinedens]MCP2161445.1 putative mycofactocin binding protein MftB [Williamsia serinedens]
MASPAALGFDASIAWVLDPRVAVRPEPFGALLYHFGTRRLSFLKSLALVELVRSLGDHPTAAEAVMSSGIATEDRSVHLAALASLAATRTIVPVDTDQEIS